MADQYDQRISIEKHLLRIVEVRFCELNKRIELSRVAMEKRLDSMNEFRAQLNDQAGKFITRTEMELKLEVLEKDVRALMSYRDEMKGKASQSAVTVSLVISVLGLILAFIGLVLRFN